MSRTTLDPPHGTFADASRHSHRRTPGSPASVPSRHELVAALLAGTCRLADVPRLAVLLGTPVHATYAVIAVAGATPAARLGVRATLAPVADAHWHVTASVDHGIVRVAPGGSRTRPPGPALLGVRAGVSLAVDSLASVAQARELADLALSLAPRDGGLVRLDDHLAMAIVGRAGGLADALTARVLGPVLARPPADRDLLLETLTAWFDADGSTADAAATLGCHRNTVINRLRRLEELTGRRTDRPRDVVDLALALQHAARERPATRPRPGLGSALRGRRAR
jgi:hypothetical protein